VAFRLMLGARGRDPGRADLSKQLAALVRDTLGFSEEVLLTISEIDCGDPACGGAETVVLVMKPGEKTTAFKLRMPMAVVGAADIAAAWASQDGNP
jgi:hypothetical protein